MTPKACDGSDRRLCGQSLLIVDGQCVIVETAERDVYIAKAIGDGHLVVDPERATVDVVWK